MDNLLEMKNNFFQNFYIIGLPVEDIINIYSIVSKDTSEIYNNQLKDFIPKIISKFPPTKIIIIK